MAFVLQTDGQKAQFIFRLSSCRSDAHGYITIVAGLDTGCSQACKKHVTKSRLISRGRFTRHPEPAECFMQTDHLTDNDDGRWLQRFAFGQIMH
jgi:hypothetical protein